MKTKPCSPSGRVLTAQQCADIYMALDYMQFSMTGLTKNRRSSIRKLRDRFLWKLPIHKHPFP